MISHSKKFILVHIPRTGGTLVEAGLSEYGIVLQGESNYHSLYFKHASARDIQRMMGDAYASYFKFSFVRNPWDWVVSNYAYNRGLHRCYVVGTEYEVSGRTPGRIPDWAKDLSFERWLPWWLEGFNPSQLALLTDAAGRLLVDDVYRFEAIHHRIDAICRRLDLEFLPRDVDSRGRRKSVEYRDYCTEKTRRMVAEHFSEEIRLFHYSC
jgi:Sulfotransferase family